MSHIAVERNRRRQMNEHLKALRSLTPALYVKRGDQASIIGGAVDFIRELHVLLEALQANKRRRLCSNPLLPPPGTPTTPSPRSLLTNTNTNTNSSSPGSGGSSSAASNNNVISPNSDGPTKVKELAACCNSSVAEVEARISGANVLLRTLSARAPPGQAARMVALLQGLHLDVLHLNVSTLEDTVLHSFVLQIGLECQLSVEDLAFEVHQTFCCDLHQQQHEQGHHGQQQLLLELPMAAVHGDIMIN